jgi:diacylglycerol kinase (ATP)
VTKPVSAPKTVALVTNPAAGRGGAARRGAAAAARLAARGVRVVALSGGSAAESRQLARDAVGMGVDAVVAVGGDGLIRDVLAAVALTSTPLAIVPAGTGNDLARELGIPRDDPRAAADVVVDGVSRPIDLGRVGDRWFATVMSSGFDSKVTQRANAMTWPRGRMRYNLAILAELAALRPIRYRVELDDEVVELDATLVAVGNSRSYGGGMMMCPGARLDDGLLDVTVVGATGRARLLRLLPTVYRGAHVRIEGVRTFRARQVRLSVLDGSVISADADGEPVGSLPVTAEAVAQAVAVMMPERDRKARPVTGISDRSLP